MTRHTLLFVTLLAFASGAEDSPEALKCAARGNRKLRYRLE